MIERTGKRDYSLTLVTEPADTESIGIDSALSGRRRTRVGDLINLVSARTVAKYTVIAGSNAQTNGERLRAALAAAAAELGTSYSAGSRRGNILLQAGRYDIGEDRLDVPANITITGLAGDRESTVIIANPDRVTNFRGVVLIGQAALGNLRIEITVNAFPLSYTADSDNFGELDNVHIVNTYESGAGIANFISSTIALPANIVPPVMRRVKTSFTGPFVHDGSADVRDATDCDFNAATVFFGTVRNCVFRGGISSIQSEFHSCSFDAYRNEYPLVEVADSVQPSRFYNCVFGAGTADSSLLPALVNDTNETSQSVFANCAFRDDASTAGRFDGDGVPLVTYPTLI
jgi:hypothetical protein